MNKYTRAKAWAIAWALISLIGIWLFLILVVFPRLNP